jgi:hypothetical protein
MPFEIRHNAEEGRGDGGRGNKRKGGQKGVLVLTSSTFFRFSS